MSWNYRVVKEVYDQEAIYGVHEVYYRADTDDHPESWTAASVSPHGETRAELVADYRRWRGAFTKPVLVARGQAFTADTEPPIGGEEETDVEET